MLMKTATRQMVLATADGGTVLELECGDQVLMRVKDRRHPISLLTFMIRAGMVCFLIGTSGNWEWLMQ
jgi:hypothetical protein